MTDISESNGDQIAPPTYQPTYGSQKPRAVIVLNGSRYPVVEYELTGNAHGSTDEGTATLPISSQDGQTPGIDFSQDLFRGTTAITGTGQSLVGTAAEAPLASGSASSGAIDDSPVYLQIYAGYPSDPVPYSTDISQLQSRFIGIVDAYQPNFGSNTVSFTFRSLAAPLVDTKLTKVVVGLTSIAFAAQVAASIGLNFVSSNLSNPITVQETLAQEFVGGSNFNVALYKLTPWQLLLQMAQFDDCDVWVDQSTLYYMRPYDVQRTTIALGYGRDFAEIDGTHSIEFNKNIRVEVRSYQRTVRTSHVTRAQSNAYGGVTTTQSVKTVVSNPVFGTADTVSSSYNPATGTTTTSLSSSSGGSVSASTSPGSESGLQVYKIYRPNISPARANQLAQSLWRQYSQHQFGLTFTIPVTPTLLSQVNIASLFKISQLPYSLFNDTYWPRRIRETFNLNAGFQWQIEAVNTILPAGAV